MSQGSSRATWVGVLGDAALSCALCAFAFAQPLLDLLGKNPTFFVAHDLDGWRLVALGIAVLTVPSVVPFAVLLAARAGSGRWLPVARAVVVGVLAAFAVLGPLMRALDVSRFLFVLAPVLGGGLLTFAYARVQLLRTFVAYLTPVPVLFLAYFLFVSPSHVLVIGSGVATATVDASAAETPVVMVVLDEFPLGVLLDEGGAIDAERFPGFARLAASSTWYPNATTVALHTHSAVPAIATGSIPVDVDVPVASAYPRSLFTMLAPSHHLHVTETLTQLCPPETCRHRPTPASPDPNLVDDVTTVFLRTLLSDRAARDWGVPAINDRWSGFGVSTPHRELPSFGDVDELTLDEQVEFLVLVDKLAEIDAFLDDVGTGKEPGLWFLHSLLPHQPFELLPTGQRYPGVLTGLPERHWTDDDRVVIVGAQRLLLQTMALDQKVTALLDRLEDTGLIDTAMVVVAADHGSVFQPGADLRAFDPPWVTNANKHEILPVPLFVKYPGQRTGRLDDRDASTIDILPTIVDVLDVDLPPDWDFDGRSLSAKRAPPRPLRYIPDVDHEAITVEGPVDAGRFARKLHAWFGVGGQTHDGFRIGPFDHLVGTSPDSHRIVATSGTVTADDWSAYEDIDRTGPEVPALFEASVTGVGRDAWLAVALNGTIAGIGPVYEADDGRKLVAVLDPALMVDGANEVRVYEVIDSGGALRPLRNLR